MKEPRFSLGIEEEYLVVDKATRDLVEDLPSELLNECAALSQGQQVKPEFMRSQIEIGTRVCANVAEARESLSVLRRSVIEATAAHGLRPLAVSTHPFANWHRQEHTPKQRYDVLSQEMQAAAWRMVISGMHVHVGIEDDELRIDLMGQFSYFVPHLLALSCSSPFWEGEDTGLRSFRPTVFDALPRTGIPERFSSYAEYRRHVAVLIDAGVIEDATKIWWDVRPSDRYPTLETRVMDVCTRIEDAICIAAIIVSTLRLLWRLRERNQSWRNYAPMLIAENRWRAMRYGTDGGLIDFGTGEIVPFKDLMSQLTELIYDDAQQLGCATEVEHALVIAERGTSAHEQLRIYAEAVAAGDGKPSAMQRVVDHLANVTGLGVHHEG
jgi:carboxylate-amine ligase